MSDTAARLIHEGIMSRPKLHPEILTKNGRKEFAVLPYEEFIALQEWLEDLEDLVELRAAKDADQSAPTVTLSDVEKQFEEAG